MNEQVQGDPRRQANDAIRGIEYQFWQSVHAWLELDDDEHLFLEGAEDLDVVKGKDATTVQVKNTTSNVTLRSSSVRAAISNYWDIFTRNPKRKIQYRFVTTSGIGVEEGEPFGAGVSGLAIWKACAQGIEPPNRLQDFLKADEGLPQELRDEIGKFTPGQFLSKIVKPLTWETGAPALDYVENEVRRKLICHGDKFAVSPPDAEAVAAVLNLEAKRRVITKDNRGLTKTDWLKIFHDSATESVPKAEIRAFRQIQKQVGATLPYGLQNAALPSAINLGATVITPLPPENHGLLTRKNLIGEMRTRLKTQRLLVVTGSTGSGKSSLAVQLAHVIGGQIAWVDLRNVKGQDLKFALRSLGAYVDTHPGLVTFVLDDLDLHVATVREIENLFGGILYTAYQRNMNVIITSNREPPDRFARALRLAENPAVSAPSLTIEEITQLAEMYGCPADGRSKAWALHISIQTSGHPQLVHAQVVKLRSRNWPWPTTDTFAAPSPDIALERHEAQTLVNELTPVELEMIQRLSLVPGSFRRDHVAAIGSIEPAQLNPGLSFDGLVGPWVERVDSEYFRLSPLLSGVTSGNWTRDKIIQMQVNIGYQILRCQPMSLKEAQSVMLLAISTQDLQMAFPMVASLLEAPHEKWPAIASHLSWLIYWSTGTKKCKLPSSPTVNTLMRKFQFRIAVEVDPVAGPEILQAWHEEISAIEDVEMASGLNLLLALDACLYSQVPLTGEQFVDYLFRIHESEGVPPLHQEMLDPEDADFHLPEDLASDSVKLLFAMSVERCCERDFLSSVFTALKSKPAAFRDRLLATFQSSMPVASLMMNKTWLSEAERDSPDWDACLETCTKIQNAAKQLHCYPMVEAAARARCIILEDYKDDSTTALNILDEAEKLVPSPAYFLQDGRATTLFHHGDPQAALEIWTKLIPIWPLPPSGFTTGVGVLSCRLAGIAASRLGDWVIAKEMFLEGHRRASAGRIAPLTIGFLADAAYSAWKAGQREESLRLFTESLELISKELESAEAVYRLVGATILWCRHQAGEGIKEVEEPTPGSCSNPALDVRLNELPLVPIDYNWLNLIWIEFHLGGSRHLYNQQFEYMRNSPYPVVRFLFAELVVRDNLRIGKTQGFPEDLSIFLQSFSIANVNRTNGNELFEIDRGSLDIETDAFWPDLRAALIGALLIKTANRESSRAVLAEWRSAGTTNSAEQYVHELISLATEIFQLSPRELEVRMLDPSSREEGLLAAVRLCELDESVPDHMFYAHTILTAYFSRSYFSAETEAALDRLVTRQWLGICACPAALRNPRHTVPEMQEKCRFGTGYRRVAGVLLAAEHAVRTVFPTSIREMLLSLSETRYNQSPKS